MLRMTSGRRVVLCGPNRVTEMALSLLSSTLARPCRWQSAFVVLLPCSEVCFAAFVMLLPCSEACNSMRCTCLLKCLWEMEVSFCLGVACCTIQGSRLDISLDSDWVMQEVHTDAFKLIVALVNGD